MFVSKIFIMLHQFHGPSKLIYFQYFILFVLHYIIFYHLNYIVNVVSIKIHKIYK